MLHHRSVGEGRDMIDGLKVAGVLMGPRNHGTGRVAGYFGVCPARRSIDTGTKGMVLEQIVQRTDNANNIVQFDSEQ